MNMIVSAFYKFVSMILFYFAILSFDFIRIIFTVDLFQLKHINQLFLCELELCHRICIHFSGLQNTVQNVLILNFTLYTP